MAEDGAEAYVMKLAERETLRQSGHVQYRVQEFGLPRHAAVSILEHYLKGAKVEELVKLAEAKMRPGRVKNYDVLFSKEGYKVAEETEVEEVDGRNLTIYYACLNDKQVTYYEFIRQAYTSKHEGERTTYHLTFLEDGDRVKYYLKDVPERSAKFELKGDRLMIDIIYTNIADCQEVYERYEKKTSVTKSYARPEKPYFTYFFSSWQDFKKAEGTELRYPGVEWSLELNPKGRGEVGAQEPTASLKKTTITKWQVRPVKDEELELKLPEDVKVQELGQ